MQDFGNFLAEHWLQIITLLVTIGGLILAIKKKQTKVVANRWTEIISQISALVPALVIDAEQEAKKKSVNVDAGNFKHNYVVNNCLKIAEACNEIPLTDLQRAQIIHEVDLQIEDVLNAPTKKGGLGRGEEK